MKKVFMAISAALMLSLVACGGGNKSAKDGESTEPKTEEAASSSADLDQYLQLIDEATPLLEKYVGGDSEAVKKYTEIVQKLSSLSEKLQKELANNPDLLKKFNDANKKFTEAFQKVMPAQK